MEVSLSDSRPVSFERGVRRAGWTEGKENFFSDNPREQTEMVFPWGIYTDAFRCGHPRGKNLHATCFQCQGESCGVFICISELCRFVCCSRGARAGAATNFWLAKNRLSHRRKAY